ncbi:MAG: branched-chain amino acid ABC transporter permease [Bacillota bacterium]
MLANIFVNTLIHASVYALLALGFSLTFGVARIINLTHTAFYMLAAYLIFTFVGTLGLNSALAILLSIVLVTIIGMLSYKVIIEPLHEHDTTVLIVTIALALAFQEVMLILFGGHFRGVPSLVKGFVTFLGVRVTNQYLVVIAVLSVILVLVWLLLLKTRLGLAIRVTAQDREVANLMGINVSLMSMVTMGLATMLAATAGALVAPIFILEPRMWLQPLTIVLAIVVLGGLGSLKGSVYGAIIIALVETLVVFLVPMGSFLRGAVSLAIMIIILIIRPEGLFGVSFEGER